MLFVVAVGRMCQGRPAGGTTWRTVGDWRRMMETVVHLAGWDDSVAKPSTTPRLDNYIAGVVLRLWQLRFSETFVDLTVIHTTFSHPSWPSRDIPAQEAYTQDQASELTDIAQQCLTHFYIFSSNPSWVYFVFCMCCLLYTSDAADE